MVTARDEDPRVQRSREAIIQAAAEILTEDGPAAVTHQSVAKRAFVGRATVYRHWPSSTALLKDVIGTIYLPFLEDIDGDLQTVLERDLILMGEAFSRVEVARPMLYLIEYAQYDPVAREHRDNIFELITARLAVAFSAAEQQGEIRHGIDADDYLAQLAGPILFSTLIQGRQASQQLIRQLVHTFIEGANPK